MWVALFAAFMYYCWVVNFVSLSDLLWLVFDLFMVVILAVCFMLVFDFLLLGVVFVVLLFCLYSLRLCF